MNNKSNYHFIGINGAKRERLIELLYCCKEIRDTMYPMKDSIVTNLQIKEFTASKLNDVYTIDGILLLQDGERTEKRTFEANIIDDEEIKIYLDIERTVKGSEKIIKTSESIRESESMFTVYTKYSQINDKDEKNYVANVFRLEEYNPFNEEVQLSALA